MKAFNQASDSTQAIQATTPAELELRAIDRQQRRFGRLSLLAIVVSFVHMAAALALFSGAAWYEVGAALAMTALVDVATWMLAGYFDYAARRQLACSRWIKVTFGFALAISMFLNGAYLYANRPASLPGLMGIAIAAAFAVFVPLLIGVASLIRGELEDDRLRIEQQAAKPVALAAPAPVPSPRRTSLPSTHRPPTFANSDAGARTSSANRQTFANNGATPQPNGDNDASVFANDGAEHGPASVAAAPLIANTETTTENTTAAFANEGTPPAASVAPISTSDVEAIAAALRSANVTQFANARALAKICGWASSSSGHKALKHLLDAGVVRATGDGYTVVREQQERSVGQ